MLRLCYRVGHGVYHRELRCKEQTKQINSVTYRKVSEKRRESEWYGLEIKSILSIRPVQRENFHGPEINHSLLQLEQREDSSGFPQDGLSRSFRNQVSSSYMVQMQLQLLPSSGAGLPTRVAGLYGSTAMEESRTATDNLPWFS